MQMKLIRLTSLFLLLNVILASCSGSSPGRTALALATEAPAATEAPTSIEETLTEIPATDQPVATDEQKTATEQPTFAEEQSSPTPELTSTQEPIPTDIPTLVEEPTATEELVIEGPTLNEPAEGFWAVSGPDGQVNTVAPNDWLPTDNFAFQIEFNNEETTEVMDVSGLASPDHNAFMYFMVYADQEITEWNKSLAQERALRILNKMHTNDVGDIEVVDVKSMADGSERLSWSSDACDCSGVIAYKAGPPIAGTVVHRKNLWLFNTFYINSYRNKYIGIFDYAFELLTFPPEESKIDP